MATIYYVIPDLYKKDFSCVGLFRSLKNRSLGDFIRKKCFPIHKPVGGIKVMYQHCLILRELGYNAYPLLLGDYVGDFFGFNIQTKHIREVGYDLDYDDVVVSMDLDPYQGLMFNNSKKLLFMQNGALHVTERLKELDACKSYLDIGYDYVITCGQYCSNKVWKEMGIPSFAITNGIDVEKFKPKPDIRVPYRVLAMSRKNPSDLDAIVKIMHENQIAFDLRVVDGLTEDELIKEYQKSDIFLATGYPEGFSLPPLEAMSCGCVVVGFSGGGGNEFMLDNKTALVATDGDCEGAAKKLIFLLKNKEVKEKLRLNGIAEASKFTINNTKKMLHDFYKNILNCDSIL